MLDILARIRKSAPKTSSELREALTDLDLVQAQTAVSNATEARRRALLDPDAKALDRAESALAGSLCDLDRLRALEEDLQRRLAETSVAEAEAELNRGRADADALAATAAKNFRVRYAAIAAELTELVEAAAKADDAVRAINSALISAGRNDTILAVEDRAWPLRPGVGVTRPAFAHHLSLPARGGFRGAGDGHMVAQLFGSIE